MRRDEFVWFDNARVVYQSLQLLCVVGEKVVPLPMAILHPKCKLAQDGDVGRLGVPKWWAQERGLCGDERKGA
jgi:hypothetical protein